MPSPRVVVCSLGGTEDPWLLPAATPTDRAWIHGGERTLYEFATAAAAAGFDVELRGEIHHPSLDEMTEAAGVSISARDLAPRRPGDDDIVVIPEGWTNPTAYLRVALSPARPILLLCGPPGLVGWDFTPSWAPPDLHTVDPDNVARADTFAAMQASGFELVSNVDALVERAEDGGVPCASIGTGRPTPWPSYDEPRSHDVTFLGHNRWADPARDVAREVGGATVLEIGERSHADLTRELARAKVLVWTGRIEGAPRPINEARAVGTVPVVLRSPTLGHLGEEEGAVVVDTLDEMPSTIGSLLSDRSRWAMLSERGERVVRERTAWEPHVERVGRVLRSPQPDPGRSARTAAGMALDSMLGDAAVDEATDPRALRRAYEALRRRNTVGRAALADRVAEARLELDVARRELEAARREIADRERRLAQLRATKTFRYTAAIRAPYEWFRRRRNLNEP